MVRRPSEIVRGARKKLAKRRVKKKAAKSKRRRKVRKAKKKAQEKTKPARDEAAETKQQVKLIASDLGVSGDRARAIISRGSAALEQAQKKGGGALDSLDVDDDGDTDILEMAEADIDTAGATGVEAEIGFDGSIEDDLDIPRPDDDGFANIDEGPIEEDL